MDPISPITADTAEWHQPHSMQRRYELRVGDRLAATPAAS